MKLKIITPEKLVLEREAVSVTLPGKAGQLTVLEGHYFLMTELVSGCLYFRYEDKEGKPQREDYRVGSGLAEATKNTVTAFVSSAERVSSVGSSG
jgi:F-type H+-transporting ATPase subunit epsilon